MEDGGLHVFSHAQNIQVNGGCFNITATNGGNSKSATVEGPRNGIDHLRNHSALAALLDSSERFNPPKCDPDTRLGIIGQIMEWVKSENDSSPVMWLRGPAGVGKSALAQSIAERCQKERRLAATYFFSRTALTRSDGSTLIPTIAYQLALFLSEARYSFRRAVEMDLSIFKRSNDTQVEKLLVEPLNSWLSLIQFCFTGTLPLGWFVPLHPLLVVIDGLDECYDTNIQCDLLKALGKAIKRLRLPFRLLITSRPESHIHRTFDFDEIFKTIGVTRIDLSHVTDAPQDIKTYLSKQFLEIQSTHLIGRHLPNSWPGEATIAELVHRSSGQFIYAKTVIIYIQSPKHRPDDRLQVILGLSPLPASDSPYLQLDTLYTHIFSMIPEQNIDALLRIFGVLIIPRRRQDGLGDYSSPARMERLLGFRSGDVELLFDDLMSISLIRDNETPITILHASLADFLQDPLRSGRFHVDKMSAHVMLAKGFMKCISDANRNLLYEERDSYILPFRMHCDSARIWDSIQVGLAQRGLRHPCNKFMKSGNRENFRTPYLWFMLEHYFEQCFQ